MPAARYWRAVGLEAHAGGDLELSALHVYDAGGRVDAGATLTSTIAPAAGALASLQDADSGTTARFAAAAIETPSFALRWDFGAPVDVYGVRAGGPASSEFLKSLTLQYSSDGVTWGEFAAQLGDFIYPGAGALTATPTSRPWIYSQPGFWSANSAAVATSVTALAVSSDGRTILSGKNSSFLQISRDGGPTWEQQNAPGLRSWTAAAMSPDGLIIAALSSSSAPWLTRDGGITWSLLSGAGSRTWSSAALSADGQTMLFVAGTSPWLSLDGGATWAPPAGGISGAAVAVSADGQTMIIGGSSTYISTDGGISWSRSDGAATITRVGAGISDDGLRMVISGAFDARISADRGNTWSIVPLGSNGWEGAAMSGDGETVAVNKAGKVYISKDGGGAWQISIGAEGMSVDAMAMASSGRHVLVGHRNTQLQVFTLRDPMFADPPPRTIGGGATEFFASSPIPDFTTIKLPDVMPWRDMEFAGNGKVTGTVKEKNTPANTPLRRRVRLVREIDGLQIRETWSDASTGAYEFLQIDERHKYSVISYDHLGNYRAVIADSLTPETLI